MVFKRETAICLVLFSRMPKEVETVRGPDLSKGYVQQGSKMYTFDPKFSTTPAVAVLSQVAMVSSMPSTKTKS
jgi:hypothetical protein